MERCMSAIVVAGGSGTRFGGEQNKVYRLLQGKPVVQYSLELLLAHPAVREVIFVYRKEDEEDALSLAGSLSAAADIPLLPVPGGASRQESVYRGLQRAQGKYVLIQDAARPRIRADFVDACLEALKLVPGAAVAVKAKDTVKLTDENGLVTETTDRSRTWLVQTPQCFHRETLLAAHEKYAGRPDITDDCMLLELEGLPVRLVPGDYANIKLTEPEDLRRLEQDTVSQQT